MAKAEKVSVVIEKGDLELEDGRNVNGSFTIELFLNSRGAVSEKDLHKVNMECEICFVDGKKTDFQKLKEKDRLTIYNHVYDEALDSLI